MDTAIPAMGLTTMLVTMRCSKGMGDTSTAKTAASATAHPMRFCEWRPRPSTTVLARVKTARSTEPRVIPPNAGPLTT